MDVDYTFKVVLAGEEGVGKTSLIKRYIDKTFSNDMKRTIGVNFLTKYINIKEDKICLQLWDAAGQEQFRFMSNVIMSGARGIIYVADMTKNETLSKLNDWIKLNQMYNKNSCHEALVLNKQDLYDEKLENAITPKLIGKFFKENSNCKISRLYETSAKTGERVNEVFEDLGNAILNSIK